MKTKLYVIRKVNPGWKIFLSRGGDLIPVDENTSPISEKSILIAVNQLEMKILRAMIGDIESPFWVAQSEEYDSEFDN